MTNQAPIRRSFVQHCLASGDAGTDRLPHDPSSLILRDLSLVPRWGLKGREAFAWLRAHNATTPERNNAAERQPDGTLIARLSPGESLILGPPDGATCLLGKALDAIPCEGSGAIYHVPRRDSHCWFTVTGASAARMFAKLCPVDLAPDRFANGSVAQTSAARLSAIIIRDDRGDQLSFCVLVDSASAEYFWDWLIDAMSEFGGPTAREPGR